MEENTVPIAELYTKAKQVTEKNQQILEENGQDQNDERLHSFVYEGMTIVNPFMDDTMRFPVDPIAYYGEEYLYTFISETQTV